MILQLYPSWSQLSHLTKNENMTCNGMPEMPYVRHFWRSTQFGKNNHFEGVRVKKIIHKKYHMQKIWSKSVISALWSAESNLQRHIEGSHRALYFQSRSQRKIVQQCTTAPSAPHVAFVQFYGKYICERFHSDSWQQAVIRRGSGQLLMERSTLPLSSLSLSLSLS